MGYTAPGSTNNEVDQDWLASKSQTRSAQSAGLNFASIESPVSRTEAGSVKAEQKQKEEIFFSFDGHLRNYEPSHVRVEISSDTIDHNPFHHQSLPLFLFQSDPKIATQDLELHRHAGRGLGEGGAWIGGVLQDGQLCLPSAAFRPLSRPLPLSTVGPGTRRPQGK
ncbi:hypothetical protein ANO11243_015330 [Dothideomycetidae sp. 11243]|nr:hypothetical protein ANO11243_015330 [fungal sp. No.11243]